MELPFHIALCLSRHRINHPPLGSHGKRRDDCVPLLGKGSGSRLGVHAIFVLSSVPSSRTCTNGGARSNHHHSFTHAPHTATLGLAGRGGGHFGGDIDLVISKPAAAAAAASGDRPPPAAVEVVTSLASLGDYDKVEVWNARGTVY